MRHPILRTFWVALLFAGLSAVPGQAEHRPVAVVDLEGPWMTRLDDGQDWAASDLESKSFEAEEWRQVHLPATWRELDYEDIDTAIWLRMTSVIQAGELLPWMPNGPAILIGACRYGRYDLYVNGRFVGASGPPDKLPTGEPRVFPLPAEIFQDTGRVVVALRVEKLDWATTNASGGPVGAAILLGDRAEVTARIELLQLRELYSHRVVTAMVFLFALIGLYHLELFRHHRKSEEYFWFGLMSLAFALATALTTTTAASFLGSVAVVEKLHAFARHMSLALQIQFLWILVQRPIGKLLRAYQIVLVAIGVTCLVLPIDWVVMSSGFSLLLALAIFPWIAAVFLDQVRQTAVDARLIGVAGMGLLAASGIYVLGELTGHPMPTPLPAWAFTLFVLAMVVTLVMRFRQTHEKLDALNQELESRVESRTRELSVKERSLAKKEREIFLAQDQLARSEKMVALGHLVAGVAHAMESPARFISSGLPSVRRDVDMLADRVPDEAREESFEKLRTRLGDLLGVLADGAARITEIVSNLRSYSRQDDATLAPSDIHQQIESALQLLEGRLDDRIEIVRRFERELPNIECYPTLLRQALVNLLTNSIQSIRDQGTITLTTRLIDKEHVRLSIRDDGHGMPAHVQRRIFEPFFSTRPSSEATGLGLSITSGIVGRHQGNMEIASVVDHGTEVVLTLPIRQLSGPGINEEKTQE